MDLFLIELRATDRPLPLTEAAYAASCVEQIWFRFSAQDRDEPQCRFAMLTLGGAGSTQLSVWSAEYPVLAFARAFAQAIDHFLGRAQLPGSFDTVDDVEDLRRFLWLGSVTRGLKMRAGKLATLDSFQRPTLRFPCPLHVEISPENAQRAQRATEHWRPPCRLLVS